MESTDLFNGDLLVWLFFCSGLTFWFINSPLTSPLLDKIKQPTIKRIVGCSFCVGFFVCLLVYIFANKEYKILNHFIYSFGGASFIHLILSFMDRPEKDITITMTSKDE